MAVNFAHSADEQKSQRTKKKENPKTLLQKIAYYVNIEL
jgi:hypothetical protein